MNTLTINPVKRARAYKFGIFFGSACLAKFKTEAQAIESLESKRSFYEYWSGSASVSVENSKKTNVSL